MCLAKPSNPKKIFPSIHQCWDGGMRGAIEFAVPHRGAGVLDQSEVLAVPGELASPYLSAGLCPDRRSERRPGGWPLFSVCFRFFRCSKKRSKNGPSKNRFFSGNFGDFWASDVDVKPFWVSKRVSGGSSRRVFRPFFQTQFCIVFSSFSRYKM